MDIVILHGHHSKHKGLPDTIIMKDVTIKMLVPIEYSPDANGRKGLLTYNAVSCMRNQTMNVIRYNS